MAVRKEDIELAPQAEGERTFAFVPLNRLKKSLKNIRKVPHSAAYIHSLAATIHAHGQTHNSVVEPEMEDDVPTGYYLVTDGEGRRLAQLHRVTLGQIAEDHPIPCLIDTGHAAEALSTAGNIYNPLHAADQFEAFKTMVDGGKSIQEVADEFGVEVPVVERRLKLANIAPEFIEMYRQGADGVALEHLMALAVTDDHERQRKAWESLPKNYRHPSTLREALTRDEVSTASPVARFVGDAYRKANGPVRKDLFSREDEGFIVDIELLNRLVDEKLAKAAAKLKKERFAWVEATPRLLQSDLSGYSRVETILREPTDEEAARLKALDDEARALQAEAEGLTEGDEERAEAIDERLGAIQEEEQAITEARRMADPEQQAVAGAIVTIDTNGKLKIERGLIKAEDKKRLTAKRKAEEPAEEDASAAKTERTHSAALVRRLTAHQTLALQATLAERPDVALVAVAHRLLSKTFFHLHGAESALQIDVSHADLNGYGEDLRATKAHKALEERKGTLAAKLPEDGALLLQWLTEQSQETLLELLAFCVATTLFGVRGDESASPIDALGRAAGLDMREWWQPTVATYFGSVPKARMIKVVSEAAGPEATAPLPLLKKNDAAEVAEQRVAGKGWLPDVLRMEK